MQKCFQFIALITFLLGLFLVLSNVYQPHLLYTEAIYRTNASECSVPYRPLSQRVEGATVPVYLLPDLAERLPDIVFSLGVFLIGVLGIYTDIYRPQQELRQSVKR